MSQNQPKTIGYLRVSTIKQDVEKKKAEILALVNTKKDNSFENLRALLIYLLAGFANAMLQITLMTSLRGWIL